MDCCFARKYANAFTILLASPLWTCGFKARLQVKIGMKFRLVYTSFSPTLLFMTEAQYHQNHDSEWAKKRRWCLQLPTSTSKNNWNLHLKHANDKFHDRSNEGTIYKITFRIKRIKSWHHQRIFCSQNAIFFQTS